jgi:hypothetical protein
MSLRGIQLAFTFRTRPFTPFDQGDEADFLEH